MPSKMEAKDIISLFKEFFENNKIEAKTQSLLEVDFNALLEWNIDLANELLENPEETIKAAEIALNSMDLEKDKGKEIPIWFINLPKIVQRNIWEIRKDDIGKMLGLKGIINKASSIVHMCKSARFECPSCGSIFNVLQLDSQFKEPSKCSCGRKGKMTLLDKEISDTIKLGLIDDLMEKDNVDRSIAREKLSILSGDDLTSHTIDRMIRPGRKVIVNGYFKYEQKPNSREFDSIFYVNSIEFVKVGWDTIPITEGEENEIIKLAKEPNIIERLSESIADIEGYKEAKKACLLLLAGAPHMYDKNGHLVSRGTIHLLLIGNPGTGKSFLAKRASSISPINYFQSAATASGKGLVASVVKDPDIDGYAVYPGVVAMATKGVCISGKQKIMTNKGLLSIKDVRPGDEVLSLGANVKPKKIFNIFYNGIKDTIKLTLYSGDTIVCTPDHQIMTNSGWKPARDLTKKDYIKNFYSSRAEQVSIEDLEEGWLFGFALSDIWYNTSLKKGSKACVRNIMSFSASKINKDRSEYICKLLAKKGITNINVKSRMTAEHVVVGKLVKFGETSSYKFSDAKLHREIKQMMEKNLLPNSSYSFYLGFLAGILSTDSCISHKKGRYGIKHEITITPTRYNKPTQTKEWNRNVQTLVNSLLHRFGILSCIRGDKIVVSSITSYNLCVLLFKEYMVGKNKDKLYYIKPKKKISSYDNYMDDKYVVWFNNIKFNTTNTVKYGLHSSIWYAKKKGKVSGRLIWTLYKYWNKITDEEFIPPIKNYFLNKVILVEEAGKEEVYDLTIPETHNFMLTGGLVHNCTIDEIDKTHKDDYGDHNNAMNDMQITLAKANIKAKLEAETSYLATANPENRVFTSFNPYHEQIAMPKDFQDRFDIIFPMLPATNAEERNRIMDIMLERHVEASEQKVWNPEFTHEFIRKYVAYCRHTNPAPKVSRELFKSIKKRLTELMRPKDDEQVKVSYRHLESIMRFAYASARLRLRDMAEEDIDLAFTLKLSSFKDLGIIDTSGIYNWNIEEGVQEEKISDDKIIHDILKEMLDTNDFVELQAIIDKCKEKGVDEEKVDEYIEKKKRMGDIFEPRRGYLKRI